MRNYLSEDREITYKMRVITERKKATHLEILEPAREAGRKFLLIENDIWMYAPEVGKSLRLSARDKFLGSEFSNSDLMESSYEKNFKAASIDSVEDYYILEIEGKSREAPYKRITMKVRKSNFIPAELQYYTMSGRLFREMSLDSIKIIEGDPYATYMKMSNVLSTKSYTSQLAILLLLAYSAAGRLDEGRALIEKGCSYVGQIVDENLEKLKKLAVLTKDNHDYFLIGRDLAFPSALEGALKIKEVS